MAGQAVENDDRHLPAIARLTTFATFLRHGAGIEVVVRHQLCFHVVYRILQALDKLHHIFFVQKDFMFFVGESLTVLMIPSLALGDGDVVVIRPRRLDVKKVGSFPCSDLV